MVIVSRYDRALGWHKRQDVRCQLVSLANKESPTLCVRDGVPQGSILGPLLFTTYIDDLPQHVTCAEIDLYADDTTLTSATHYDNVAIRTKFTDHSNLRGQLMGNGQ